jgi:hypothetical protein
MGKRLFFLSLIILSAAMGFQWFKNRPKSPPRPPRKVAVAVNLDDLEVATPRPSPDPATEPAEVATSTPPPEASDEPGDGEQPANLVASAPSEANQAAQPKEEGDPIILAFSRLTRTPFEPSPFIAMMEAAGKSKEEVVEGGEKKPTKPTSLMPGDFLGTIETPNALLAIVDSRLYKAGDLFNDIPIIKVGKELILLENESGKFIIPKKGVVVNIASDGTYTFADTFRKSR